MRAATGASGGGGRQRLVAYPAGHEPDYWHPAPEQRSHRFALGNVALASVDDPPLIAICMNPSYANYSEADKTVNRLIKASIDNKQPGWVMLNLYPERGDQRVRPHYVRPCAFGDELRGNRGRARTVRSDGGARRMGQPSTPSSSPCQDIGSRHARPAERELVLLRRTD